MKIVAVTSWQPRHCGIATYSFDLVKALRELDNEVHIVTFSDGGKKKEKFVHPVMKINHKANLADPNWNEKLFQQIEKIDPEIVHIQHEYSLYNYKGDDSSGLFRPLFKWAIGAARPVIITYHSVYSSLNRIQKYYMDISLRLIGAGIVHEEYQRDLIPINIGRVPENVFVIPHGAKELPVYRNAKRELDLEGKKVLGLLGWWEESKGFDKVVKIWPSIRKEVGTDAVLVVAGDARPGSVAGQLYKPKLLKLINKSKAKDSIRLIVGSFSPAEYDKILSSFDVMGLPYDRASQSGNLAHALALGVPCIATAMEGLKEEIEESRAGIAVAPGDTFELEHAIARVMKDEKLLKRYSINAKKYVTAKIKWSIIAKKHLALYNQLIDRLNEETKPIDQKL